VIIDYGAKKNTHQYPRTNYTESLTTNEANQFEIMTKFRNLYFSTGNRTDVVLKENYINKIF
jgi:hypothetical protein